MALDDTFEHEGLEITYTVHENGREAVARFEIGGTPREVLLRRGHRGGGSAKDVPPEAKAAITALGLHLWPMAGGPLAWGPPRRGW
jgi:hypothetical protein